ncbi:ABC transporter ATP-binding protein [Georgenia halophila]|uniref:ABC transporter ATP-binding protein n=1 Tax=Georgenia halophila TaxID=620889 RepID=UPI003CD057F8
MLRGLSFAAGRARLTAVLGPNGAGKTTTIECCEGLRHPDAGTVEVLGTALGARSASSRSPGSYDAALRARVGVMLQDGGLPQAPRAGAVLAHLARLHERPVDPAELMRRLGLTDVARTPIRRLSGGQRQRLALAAALVGRPELVFLDEPSAGLDVRARLAVWDLLRELRADGTSLVLTTHLMSEAEELADHVVVIDAGAVVAEGSPRELTGGDEIRVLPAGGTDPATLAATLERRLAGRGGLRVGTSPTGDGATAEPWVVVGADGPPDAGVLSAVATALTDVGYADATVTSHRRTLEDVFLELTGHTLEPEKDR